MKRIYLLLLFQSTTLFALAQQSTDLTSFNQNRLQRQKNAMLVLGTWAIGNIAVGSIMAGRSEGVNKNFHLMNAGWNIINLGLAGAGYYTAIKTDPAALDMYGSLQAHHGIQKTLLFNAGLDVGYMAGGFYLMERSKNADKNADRLKGFGQSIVLQGAFLFVFDLTVYFLNAKHNSVFQDLLSQVQFSGDRIGLHLQF